MGNETKILDTKIVLLARFVTPLILKQKLSGIARIEKRHPKRQTYQIRGRKILEGREKEKENKKKIFF